MNKYIKPAMKITYFGDMEITADNSTLSTATIYAAKNMNTYMFGANVAAIQTQTMKLQDVIKFK